MTHLDMPSIWTALSHPIRRKIIYSLQDKPRTTSELCGLFDVTRFAVMKHLKLLEQVSLIEVQRDGRLRWNRLNEVAWQQLPAGLLANETKQATTSVMDVVRVQQQAQLDAPAEAVFAAWTVGLDAWWPWRKEPTAHLVLEAAVNGRCFEAYDDDGAMLLAVVTAVRPNRQLTLRGTMGLVGTLCLSEISLLLTPLPSGGTELVVQQQVMGVLSDSAQEQLKARWQQILMQALPMYLSPVTAVAAPSTY